MAMVVPPCAAAGGGLTAEVYANSVMRGVPVCAATVQNGFSLSAASLCGAAHAASLVPGDILHLRVGDKIPADARVLSLKTVTMR